MLRRTKAQRPIPAAWLKSWIWLTLTMSSFGPVQSLQAQEPPRLGGIFVINGYTTDYQAASAVAVNDDGSFVVVWSSNSGGLGFTDNTIQARRFDSRGGPIGNDFQVAGNTTGVPFSSQVAAASNGDFVVVWAQRTQIQGGEDWSIQARQFLSDGTPVDHPFQVNDATLDSNFRPRVAAAPDGDFIVVWTSESSIGNDTDEHSIQGRRFGSAGVPLGDQFQVNTLTTDRQREPSVAINPDGNFLVAWQSYFVEQGKIGAEVRVQQFHPDGSRLGQEFPISSDDLGTKGNTDIAVNPEGDFTVIWSDSPYGVHSDCDSLEGRRVFSNGSFSGAPRELVPLSGCKFSPKIAHESTGGFVVVWSLYQPPNGSPFVRRFDADWEPLTEPFEIGPLNTYPGRVNLGMDEADNFIVVWDASPFEPVGDFYGIYGQRFCGTDCLLFDGFESGDTSAWSSSAGQ